MNTPTVITLPLSTFENMMMELTWRLDDCLDQAKRAWKFFEWYKIYLMSDDFPETLFPLLLQSTHQRIQQLHYQDVELLWPSHSRIFPWRVPCLNLLRTFSTPAGSGDEFHCCNCIFIFPLVHYPTLTLFVSFTESWTNSSGPSSSSTRTGIHLRRSKPFRPFSRYNYSYCVKFSISSTSSIPC